MEERRIFKRSELDENIRFNVVKGGVAQDFISHTVNISGGGLKITTNEELAPDEDVSVEIQVPGYTRAIPVRGQIAWTNLVESSNICSAGIRFTHIDTYDRQMILDYIHFG